MMMMHFYVFLYFNGYGTNYISGYQWKINVSMIIIHNKDMCMVWDIHVLTKHYHIRNTNILASWPSLATVVIHISTEENAGFVGIVVVQAIA